jgi:drug/metabolite transporter (DMT)-like permease
VAPVAAAAIGVLLGGALPSAPVWGGIVLIAAGLLLGLGRRRVSR